MESKTKKSWRGFEEERFGEVEKGETKNKGMGEILRKEGIRIGKRKKKKSEEKERVGREREKSKQKERAEKGRTQVCFLETTRLFQFREFHQISFYTCWGSVLLSECKLWTLMHIVIKVEFVGMYFMVILVYQVGKLFWFVILLLESIIPTGANAL